MKEEWDVIIAGGGLAGLTLGIQLKRLKPKIEVCIVEKEDERPPEAAHKVGESTVELGTHYLRSVLKLGKYLDENQLPKHGLRFFLSPHEKNNISKRFEIGPIDPPPVPSHQLDRGLFERKLIKINSEIGNTVYNNTEVKNITFGEDSHSVEIKNSEQKTLRCRWFVDTTGRNALIKRKLHLQEPMNHDINASWFRIKGEIDIDDWSDDSQWKSKLNPGLRRLSTNHLMGEGYWVWLIPLASGNTSIGVVADPEYHDFKEINRFEKVIDWLEQHEPQCAEIIKSKKDELMDFKVLKRFSHHTKELYSADRWCLSGDAGAFLDPFYSPGTDFIAMSNSWISDLIVSELNGEDIHTKTVVYERVYRAILDNWAKVYRNQYGLFGSTQIMTTKIIWDWANYWGIHSLMFFNEGFTKMPVLKALFFGMNGIGSRLEQLNENIQTLFNRWKSHDDTEQSNAYLDPFDIEFLEEFHLDLRTTLSDEELVKKVKSNVEKLELIAAEIIRHVLSLNNPNEQFDTINPYILNIGETNQDESKKHDVKIPKNERIAKDLSQIWMSNVTKVD